MSAMNPAEKLCVLNDRNWLLMLRTSPERYAGLIIRLGGHAALEQRITHVQADYEQILNPQAPNA